MDLLKVACAVLLMGIPIVFAFFDLRACLGIPIFFGVAVVSYLWLLDKLAPSRSASQLHKDSGASYKNFTVSDNARAQIDSNYAKEIETSYGGNKGPKALHRVV